MRVGLLWAFLVSLAAADIALNKPGSGNTYTASGGTVSIPVEFSDNGKVPTLDVIQYYVFALCYGDNTDDFNCVTGDSKMKLSDFDHSGDLYSTTASFSSSLVGNGQFFLQVNGYISGDGDNAYQSLQYSARFILKSMSGTIATTLTTTSQPANQVAYQTGTNTGAGDTSASFSIPYTEQTGSTRYAPMQTQPSGSVTATTWTRRFPTSGVTMYSTYNPSMQQASTVTPGWSYTIDSAVNWASPRPYPTQNGAWYDPKSRQTLTTRKLNLKQWVGTGFSSSS
ncbi:LAME_0G03972g1_1 [Lachancea meyersii CBS 8951]|uniref:LAME_0G03972g1_1 n=1 Tax=Lachancea meyersii CBS 8951 TaxID=1266667 RepID=A0A1G4K6T5_9SACH|nr:LAME_0G03972g1_1 [Lachancea meyersii CBS 8951]